MYTYIQLYAIEYVYTYIMDVLKVETKCATATKKREIYAKGKYSVGRV
jgi:hypothetical protein